MDSMLDQVLSVIRPFSEDLFDLDRGPLFIDTNYLELRDDVNFHQTKWHMFKETQEYLIATNGDISTGEWEHVSGNKIIIGRSTRDGVLYELAFLDEDFFILSRHGNTRATERKYFMLVREPLAKQLEWHEAITYLFDKYRNSNNFIVTVAIIVILIIAIVLLLS